ncbi:MAG TPA: 2Fe-2S iron-sulfur cluster-binding protein [Candidatus Methylomirabilis sp.]|nr:2Fe-2S iron-sulfur cluster-binding protein [Candidatus Methylomirabilis sp.]
MKIRVNAKNRALDFECGSAEKILHAGLGRGIGLPYECGTGTCGTCKARLVEGEVDDHWPEAPGRTRLRGGAEVLLCQCAPRGDCAFEVSGLVHPMASGLQVPAGLAAVIARAVMLTHDVIELELELARPLDFEAGQFALMTAGGIAGARAYSMVNFERAARRLVFVVKKKPGGRMSDWLFAAPVAGAPVHLFAPLGAATFGPDMAKNILCIAGGSGIAGMMSILSRATQAGHFHRHSGHVFFGVRTRRDLFFVDELAGLRAAAPGAVTVTIALSDEDVDPDLRARHAGLDFATGFVHAVAGQAMRGRFDNVRAYAAGPPPMVDATLRMLLVEGKLRSHDIRYDKFS